MIRIVILAIGFTSLIFSSNKLNAQQTDNIENTRWESVVVDNHVDYIEFKDSSYVTVFSCELDEKYFGDYSIKNDTIKVVTVSGEFDSEFSINSIHKHKKTEMYFLLQSDTLVFLENKKIKYKKQKSGE